MTLRLSGNLPPQTEADRWPARSALVLVPHPLNAEVNTAASFTLVEGFGKVSDLLGVGLDGDRHWTSRFGLVLFSGYANWAVTANSHEFAHGQHGTGGADL